MHFSRTFPLLVTSSSLALPCAVFAQQAQEGADTDPQEIEEIFVTGVLRERAPDELAQSITVIREQELERIITRSLGETLAGQLGVSSSYFAAGASRPVIRGLAGARVRTMEDGLDTMDASTISVDHAVSIDPVIAQQIEIFRGPTTLLYGSGAVGGVVNTVTSRIPESAPEDGFEGVVELRGDTVAGARSGVLSLDGGNDDFAWHFDYISRETDNYEIPGYADLAAMEEDHDEHEDEDHDEDHEDEDHEDEDHDDDHDDDHEEAVLGLVENSDLSGQAFSLGGSWLRENSYFGVSVSSFESNYGVPGHHHHHEEMHDDHDDEDHEDEDHDDEDHDEDHDDDDHEDEDHEDEDHEDEDHDDDHDDHEDEEEVPVRVDLKQTRVDLKGGWVGLSGPVEAINLRFGVNSYEHSELEGEEVGTLVENDAWEGRLEFMHAPWGAWDGAYGFQVNHRKFSALGAEAFVPPVDTTSYGAFILEQRDFDAWNVSLGARLDYQQQDPSGDLPTVSDSATSVSLAGVRDLGDGYSFVLNAALAERLPVAEELYANGPHVATRSIEIGDPNIGVETSQHLDIGIRSSGDGTSWSLTAFLTNYADFIYLQNTGEFDDELAIFHFEQQDADFSGIEAEFFTPVWVRGESEIDLRIFADYVNGKLGNGDYLPRMPPLRFGSRIQYHDERFVVGLEVTQYSDQDNIAAIETPTEGYTMINADFNWTVATPGGTAFDIFVMGRNLADEDARKHTSFVKDTVPLPGRNISAGFRTRF